MKTIIKIVAILLILIVIAFVALLAFGSYYMNDLVKTAIEKGGTYATQTTTTVDDVNIGLKDSTFTMSGLNISNPSGFDTTHFLSLASTSVALDSGSIMTDTINLPDVTFQDIDIILDKGHDPSNYNTILASLKRFETNDTKSAPDNAEGKKVSIDTLTLSNIDIHLANMPGVGFLVGDVAINIPTIELKDIGKDEPMTAAQVVNLVIKTVLTAAVESGGGIIPSDILGELGNGLGALTSLSDMGITAIGGAGEIVGEQIGNVLENTGAVVEDLTDGAQDAIENLTEDLPIPENLGDDLGKEVEKVADELEKGIKGIFGNKKDDDD